MYLNCLIYIIPCRYNYGYCYNVASLLNMAPVILFEIFYLIKKLVRLTNFSQLTKHEQINRVVMKPYKNLQHVHIHILFFEKHISISFKFIDRFSNYDTNKQTFVNFRPKVTVFSNAF